MLAPKRTKFRKQQRGRMRGLAKRGSEVSFGNFGLLAQGCGWITARQIEAVRVVLTRTLKRTGKVHIRIFPDKPYTQTAAETRMGKGKGEPEYWVAVVKPGRVLFELEIEDEALAREAISKAGKKLPIRTEMVYRGEVRI